MGTLYVTHMPCIDCLKLAIAAGISEIIFGVYKDNPDVLLYLNQHTRLITPNPERGSIPPGFQPRSGAIVIRQTVVEAKPSWGITPEGPVLISLPGESPEAFRVRLSGVRDKAKADLDAKLSRPQTSQEDQGFPATNNDRHGKSSS